MKRMVVLLIAVLSAAFVLTSCGSYQQGYSAGYQDGFSAGREAVGLQEQVGSLAEDNKAEDTTAEIEQEAPALQEKPEPSDGYLFETIPAYEAVAPLEVETPAGKGGYFVVCNPTSLTAASNFMDAYEQEKAKLENGGCGRLIFYVSAGSVVEVDVPLGWFDIYYATGDTWYGEEHLFGDGTRYYKFDESFRFWLDSEGTYHGWTVLIEEVSGGNLDSEEISEDEFPR